MEKENAERVEKGESTEKDFSFTQAREEELRAKFSKKDDLKLLTDEMEFNKEVQIYVLNLMHKRKLTTNYVVGTLYKLAWGIMNSDFTEQMIAIDKYNKGGR